MLKLDGRVIARKIRTEHSEHFIVSFSRLLCNMAVKIVHKDFMLEARVEIESKSRKIRGEQGLNRYEAVILDAISAHCENTNVDPRC